MRRLLGDNEVDPVMDVYKKFINHTDPTKIPILLTNPSIESISRKVPYGVGVRDGDPEDIYIENGTDLTTPLNTMIKTFKEDASVSVHVSTTTEKVTGVQQAGNQPGAYAFNGMNIYTVIEGSKNDTSLVFASKVSDDKTAQEIDYPYIIFPDSCEQSIFLQNGVEQYIFASSDRFVMTIQQPGDVYLDQWTKEITCCIYPKVHRLVDKLYFQPAPLDQKPNYLKCYSFAIDWGK